MVNGDSRSDLEVAHPTPMMSIFPIFIKVLRWIKEATSDRSVEQWDEASRDQRASDSNVCISYDQIVQLRISPIMSVSSGAEQQMFTTLDISCPSFTSTSTDRSEARRTNQITS